MPAGVTWRSYIGATVCALMSMFAGAQTVHLIYKPLKDLDAKVEIEKKKMAEASKLAENCSSS